MNKKIPFAALSSAAVLASFIAAPLAPLANEVQTESNTSLKITHYLLCIRMILMQK